MSFPIPANEIKRIEALRRYGLLDTSPEEAFDTFALLASHICGTPIALVTLIDSDRQWIKARKGLDVAETSRSDAFCAHTIMSRDVMVVEDATKDERFADNPLVQTDPNIRFYAGAPLVDSDGFGLGALCVIDRQPRNLTAEQQESLQALSRLVVLQIEYRRTAFELASALSDVKLLSGLLPMCGHCKSIRSDDGYWKNVEDYISAHSDAGFSHGICPNCAKIHFASFCDDLPE